MDGVMYSQHRGSANREWISVASYLYGAQEYFYGVYSIYTPSIHILWQLLILQQLGFHNIVKQYIR